MKKLSYEYEIIVLDDCSTDRSLNEIEILNLNNVKLVKHDSNSGKGSAIKSGLNSANGDIIIIQDADLEYDPEDYSKLLIPFEETDVDVVYGSRFIGGGKYVRFHFFWHYLANKILTFLCNIITNLNLTDMETGHKVFKTTLIKKISLKERSFGVEPEITIKLSKLKSKFYEVPISYRGRSYSEGKKIRLKDAFIAVYCIIRYSVFD